MLLLDLSDPEALRFLRCAAGSGVVGHAPHVLALLPGMAAARSVRGPSGLGSEKALQAGNKMRSESNFQKKLKPSHHYFNPPRPSEKIYNYKSKVRKSI